MVISPAPIYLYPDAARVPIRTAATNTRLRVLEPERDGWIKVEFRDPQYGNRIGFIQSQYTRIQKSASATPIDLSVLDVQPRPQSRAESRSPEPAQPIIQRRPEPAPRDRFRRGWVDVDLGFAVAGTRRYSSILNTVRFAEPASATAEYHLPLGAAFDVGGGFMVTSTFGIGLSFLGTAHQDNADIAVSVPHPRIPNVYASDTGRTEGKLTRAEGSTNIQFILATTVSPRIAIRLFGGPSYFRVRQDAVSSIAYEQDFLLFLPVNSVEITGYRRERIEFENATGWGVNVGSDVTFYLTQIVGVGGFAKYNHGSVTALDPLSVEDVKLKTGGLQTGAGLRLRF